MKLLHLFDFTIKSIISSTKEISFEGFIIIFTYGDN